MYKKKRNNLCKRANILYLLIITFGIKTKRMCYNDNNARNSNCILLTFTSNKDHNKNCHLEN